MNLKFILFRLIKVLLTIKMVYHISENCSCVIKVLSELLKNKFGTQVNFITHELTDDFKIRQNFEEQIEHMCHKQICYIMASEYIYQHEDSIFGIDHGIKKFDSGYGLVFNIMFYHNKKFYNQESEPIMLSDKYIQMINESQSDTFKLFFSNFINDKNHIVQLCQTEFGFDLYELITKTFNKLVDKI